MDFSLENRETLLDGSTRLIIQMPASELIYFGYIIESFEGWCNYTTPSRKEPYLQVDVTRDYLGNFDKLLQFLSNWEL
ncbi:MAG: DUF4911 domain-containing protein [Candidatus Cloacimonetes bacterium]|nr:DUF4911 domain-containing protein [Candidatus Cloacimonadota bacterium]